MMHTFRVHNPKCIFRIQAHNTQCAIDVSMHTWFTIDAHCSYTITSVYFHINRLLNTQTPIDRMHAWFTNDVNCSNPLLQLCILTRTYHMADKTLTITITLSLTLTLAITWSTSVAHISSLQHTMYLPG